MEHQTLMEHQIQIDHQILMEQQILMTQHNLMDHQKTNIENTLSGGASVETQENLFEDTTDAGGASSSRQQLPPSRKWT